MCDALDANPGLRGGLNYGGLVQLRRQPGDQVQPRRYAGRLEDRKRDAASQGRCG